MPLTIPNTTLQDDYTDLTTWAGNDVLQTGWFVVANNPAAVTLLVQQGGYRQGSVSQYPEQFLAPGTYPLNPGGKLSVAGIKARNFHAGQPVQFFGALYYPGEPYIASGQEYSAYVAPGGTVVSGAGGLQVVEFVFREVDGKASYSGAFQVPAGGWIVDALVQTYVSWFQAGPGGIGGPKLQVADDDFNDMLWNSLDVNNTVPNWDNRGSGLSVGFSGDSATGVGVMSYDMGASWVAGSGGISSGSRSIIRDDDPTLQLVAPSPYGPYFEVGAGAGKVKLNAGVPEPDTVTATITTDGSVSGSPQGVTVVRLAYLTAGLTVNAT